MVISTIMPIQTNVIAIINKLRTMFTFSTPESAAFWFDAFNWLLFAGAFAVAIATYGVIQTGAAKDRFADERTSANEAETRRAIADAEIAKEGTARANERAAKLEKEAETARLETERLKGTVAWRTLTPKEAESLERALAKSPGSVNLRYTDGDPEALYLAIQIANVLTKAKWQVAPGAMKPAGTLLFGVAIPNTLAAATLRQAFAAANFHFGGDDIPQNGVAFNVSTIDGAPMLFIGSRQPPAFQ
ncbi:hypothetical protein ABIC09_003410 [Bradyrhizobium sp. S3.12.5]|uniref:hypothetical protein n=1 Tax=Bradyrhizobium sp. S3.12.5 TaxID=3156386 RepID=UPI00339783E1